ncbi:T9SS type A sorting domain-containing protein [uncultured Marixanthomonas sp.]|uniref:T9SS type A sorting domain-containing protein n=1 Tax=uncultured Marixanthomonas sp. TaxID=757245 RepID=UPI0030DD9670|tara:strand:+ start:4763 stop:5596 length:834 start_codon:yes stop_codon:yes gene_type:complete
MMKKITLLAALFASVASFAQISINEVDSDQTSTDTEEFIELLSDTPNFSLDGYVVVLFNGNTTDNVSYTTVDLAGFETDSDGYFVIGSDAVSGADVTLGADNTIQNGADAVAIYQDDAANFPNETPATTTNLIDVIVYGTSDDDDTDLLAALGETVQYDENANGNKDTESLQLNTDGTYCVAEPTLRAENDCEPLSVGNNFDSQFSIYPNPASNGFVNIVSKVNGAKQIAVFDVLGKQVINTTLTGERLNIASLTSGVYIVKINQGNASVTKKLVVK